MMENYCKLDGPVSKCTSSREVMGQTKLGNHVPCRFGVKASFEDRCMHLVFDELCDCMKAQVADQRGL